MHIDWILHQKDRSGSDLSCKVWPAPPVESRNTKSFFLLLPAHLPFPCARRLTVFYSELFAFNVLRGSRACLCGFGFFRCVLLPLLCRASVSFHSFHLNQSLTLCAFQPSAREATFTPHLVCAPVAFFNLSSKHSTSKVCTYVNTKILASTVVRGRIDEMSRSHI